MEIEPLLDLKLQSLILRRKKLKWVNDVIYHGVVFNARKNLSEDINFNC